MTPQDQRFFPVAGVSKGDCWRACIASLTDTHIDLVPHFTLFGSDWWSLTQRWLLQNGFEIDPGWHGAVDGELVILGGDSPRGTPAGHCVIARFSADKPKDEWEIVHDPHPTRAGIVTREESYRVRPLARTVAS